ncbi:hypothetical protein V5J35_000192 [Endozoicomonas sp. NE40]|uniref:Uncharacterized protein n=1 Tax=Endozoicomonas lisbonensis TaxID=3120522 RepID=A0ABV2SB60_9GAMM
MIFPLILIRYRWNIKELHYLHGFIRAANYLNSVKDKRFDLYRQYRVSTFIFVKNGYRTLKSRLFAKLNTKKDLKKAANV